LREGGRNRWRSRDIRERPSTTIVRSILLSRLSFVNVNQNPNRLLCKKRRLHLRSSYLLHKNKALKSFEERKCEKRSVHPQEERRMNSIIVVMFGKLALQGAISMNEKLLSTTAEAEETITTIGGEKIVTVMRM
jgi:hypothetical protein